jgi:hypothetical protein
MSKIVSLKDQEIIELEKRQELQIQGDQDVQQRVSDGGINLKSSLTRGFDSIMRASKGR